MNEFQFEDAYQGHDALPGHPFPKVPWDIGRVQPVVEQFLRRGRIVGSVLDVGCGLGYAAVHLAHHGYDVTGIDFAAPAIAAAREHAKRQKVNVSFDVADATDLTDYRSRFDTILDLALFHCLAGEDAKRRYAAALYRASRQHALLNMVCFSDRTLNGIPAPAPVSEEELQRTLTAAGWVLRSLRHGSYLAISEAMTGVFSHIGYEYRSHELFVELPVWIIEADRRPHDPEVPA